MERGKEGRVQLETYSLQGKSSGVDLFAIVVVVNQSSTTIG